MSGEAKEDWRVVDDICGVRVVVDDERAFTLPYWLRPGSGRCERQVAETHLAARAPSMQRCLQWASALAIGVRGGWKATDVQQVLSAAARGEDWERVRDELAARKGGKR